MTRHLSPTLWRTCRALANHRRLRVLQRLLDGRARTVSAVADAEGLSEVSASQCLRALNARGLLRVRRVSRWVEYRLGADPAVPETAPLVRALRRQLRGGRAAVTATFADLTAFTHPRRLLIVRALPAKDGAALGALRAATGISEPALFRHLLKLVHRGVVGRDDGLYRRLVTGTPVLRTLTMLAAGDGAGPHSHT